MLPSRAADSYGSDARNQVTGFLLGGFSLEFLRGAGDTIMRTEHTSLGLLDAARGGVDERDGSWRE
jgi:hypothetical protein